MPDLVEQRDFQLLGHFVCIAARREQVGVEDDDPRGAVRDCVAVGDRALEEANGARVEAVLDDSRVGTGFEHNGYTVDGVGDAGWQAGEYLLCLGLEGVEVGAGDGAMAEVGGRIRGEHGEVVSAPADLITPSLVDASGDVVGVSVVTVTQHDRRVRERFVKTVCIQGQLCL